MGLHNAHPQPEDEQRRAAGGTQKHVVGVEPDDWEAVRLLPTVKASVPLRKCLLISLMKTCAQGRVIAVTAV